MKLHILSANAQLYSTRRLLEEARLAGHSVAVVDYRRNPATIKNSSDLPDIIIPRIAANMSAAGIACIEAYAALGIPSLVSAAALQKVRNKPACLEQLQAAKFPIPKSQVIRPEVDIPSLLQQGFKFPLVLKLSESTHGQGVLLVRTKTGLQRMLRLFKEHQPFLLQTFIKEAAGTDIRAFVVGDKLVASMKRMAKGDDFRSNLHRGGSAKPISLQATEQVMALNACKEIGIAVAGVDMLYSAKGLLIIEINASPGLEGIEKVSGQNIARQIIAYAASKVGCRTNFPKGTSK